MTTPKATPRPDFDETTRRYRCEVCGLNHSTKDHEMCMKVYADRGEVPPKPRLSACDAGKATPRLTLPEIAEMLAYVRVSHCDYPGYLVHNTDANQEVLEYDKNCPACVIERVLAALASPPACNCAALKGKGICNACADMLRQQVHRQREINCEMAAHQAPGDNLEAKEVSLGGESEGGNLHKPEIRAYVGGNTDRNAVSAALANDAPSLQDDLAQALASAQARNVVLEAELNRRELIRPTAPDFSADRQ